MKRLAVAGWRWHECFGMKVLVTGGAGFLGRHILKGLLARGAVVSIYGRTPQPGLAAQGIRIIQGDLGDVARLREAVAGMDAVFHVAAKAGVWGDEQAYVDTNVVGTRNVIQACEVAKVRRLVYTSTPSVVFNGAAFRGADERLPYGRNWLCDYARTKAIAEQMVLDAHDDKGLRTVAIRPHLIWGVGDPHIVPRLLDRAAKGRLRIIGDGVNRVDITHVANAAHAHLLALDALDRGTCGGKAYFVSQGEPVVLWHWIDELVRGVGLPGVEKRIPLKTAYTLGAVLEGAWSLFGLRGEPPMTRFVAVELAKDHWFDISAARRDLGYAPIVSTKDGLAELITHLRAGCLSR